MKRKRVLFSLGEGSGEYALSLDAVAAFVVVHMLMCILQVLYLPMKYPFRVYWLAGEGVLGMATAALFFGTVFYAAVRKTPARQEFGGLLRSLCEPETALLLIWVIWAAAACVLAVREGWSAYYSSARYYYYQGAEMLVLFPLGLYLGRRERAELLHLAYDLCLALFTGLMIWGMLRFAAGDVKFTLLDRPFDFSRARARMADNPNLVGAYSGLFLVLGPYRLRVLRGRWKRALLLLGLGVAALCFLMTDSRGSLLGVTLAAGMLAGAALWRRRRGRGVGAVFLSLAAGLAAAAAFLALFYALRALVLQAQTALYLRAMAEQSDAAESLKGKLVRSGMLLQGNGRLRLWRAVVQNIAGDWHTLLHGCGLSATSYWLEEFIGRDMRAHNQFLELLLAQGLPGLLLFLVWLWRLAGKSLALGLRGRGAAWMLPLALLSMLANNMAEAMLIGRMQITACFFFLIAGYVCGLAPSGVRRREPPPVPEAGT